MPDFEEALPHREGVVEDRRLLIFKKFLQRFVAETLPQTASHQPLIGLLGLLALGAAGALAIGRRFHGA